MEMTIARLGIGNVKSLLGGFVMPIASCVGGNDGSAAASYLLDTFFVSNILLSLLILMVAMHTHRPLNFLVFPPFF